MASSSDISETYKIDASSMKISELSLLSEIPDDACFAIEVNRDGQHTTYKLPYRQLRDAALRQLSSMLQFGDMAYQDSGNYAYAAHGHDYSDFWFYPSYGPQSDNIMCKAAESCVAFGRFDIVKYLPGTNAHISNSISVCVPKSLQDTTDETLQYDPKSVGDLQMLAMSCTFEHYLTAYRGYVLKNYGGKQNIDISHSSFDGYVIPNGSTFTCKSSEFSAACELYATDGKGANSTSFTVPCLSTFIKGLADASSGNALKWNA